MLKNNLDLKSMAMEIPRARANVLTASLRRNPILYADSQLVPYGAFSTCRPGGPTQYDLNMSHPIDFSHKRRARIDYATRALRVTEAQYQNAVRIEINNLYVAFVDVLAGRGRRSLCSNEGQRGGARTGCLTRRSVCTKRTPLPGRMSTT